MFDWGGFVSFHGPNCPSNEFSELWCSICSKSSLSSLEFFGAFSLSLVLRFTG